MAIRSQRLKRFLKYQGWAVLCLVLVFLLALSLAPLAGRFLLLDWFRSQGIAAQLEHVSLSPGAGVFTLGGLSTRDGQGRKLDLDELKVNIAIAPLWKRQLIIESLSVKGLYLDVQRHDGRLRIGGIDPQAQADSTTPPQPQEDSNALAEWRVEIRNLELEHWALCALVNESGKDRSHLCAGFEGLKLEQGLQVLGLSPLQLKIPGVALSGWEVTDKLQDQGLLKFKELQFKDLQMGPDRLELQSFGLTGFGLLERSETAYLSAQFPFAGQLQSISLDRVAMNMGQSLTLGNLTLQRLQLAGHRDSSEALPALKAIEGLQQQLALWQDNTQSNTTAAEKTEAGDGDKEPGTLRLQLQSAQIGGASEVVWLDEGLEPAQQQRLGNIAIQVGSLDSGQTEMPTPVSLDTQINEAGRFFLQGELWPFKQQLNLVLEGGLEALDVLPFSPYVEQASGFQIERGQVASHSKIAVADNILDVKTNIKLSKFYLQAPPEKPVVDEAKQPQEESAAEDIPVGLALNLLRDSDDNIELELPIKGNVDAPDFSLRDLYATVARKALTTAVINYYTPYGLVDIAGAVVKSATKLRFDPLYFQAGSTRSDGSHNERLSQLASLLAAKPQISLSFCPELTAADALSVSGLASAPEKDWKLTEQQHQQLLELGRQRSVSIQRSLLDAGAGAGQLILCQPQLALNSSAKPNVAISL
jgi:hypothetical protein